MIKREEGFSLIELVITVAVFVLIIASSSRIFTSMITQFKQQSKIAETQIEGIVGLEMLRQDLDHAGYGLPWEIPGVVNYDEASNADASPYNDSPGNPPRALLSGDATMLNGSDYLVVKSTPVAVNSASQKWTYFTGSTVVYEWEPASENLETDDRVIVLSSGVTSSERRLVDNAGVFYTTYVAAAGSNPDNDGVANPAFEPMANYDYYWVYGLNGSTAAVPRMPFNRADYFIRNLDSGGNSVVPVRCAGGDLAVPTTGILTKFTIDHGAVGGYSNPLYLFDCVADFQVAFGVDTDDPPDDQIDCYTNDLSNNAVINPPVDDSAQNVRERVREVRMYILAHEGQLDRAFTLDLVALNAGINPAIADPTKFIRVGEMNSMDCTGAEPILGTDFNLATITADTTWQNYRWKVYTIVEKPNNLM